MDPGWAEEMALGEVDADEADARGPHMERQAERDIGRVPRVVQRIRV